MNPRMVEELAAPIKELAERALELDERRRARSSSRFGHSVDEMHAFARRLKQGPRELRAVQARLGPRSRRRSPSS